MNTYFMACYENSLRKEAARRNYDKDLTEDYVKKGLESWGKNTPEIKQAQGIGFEAGN